MSNLRTAARQALEALEQPEQAKPVAINCKAKRTDDWHAEIVKKEEV